ncbi:hypothetical protein JA1_002362 [Spathaspora sp. JA1]|nr:hypothetical protein JA1_002362 [Spathaspora sp. JA1]
MSKALSCFAFETLINKLNLDTHKISLSTYFDALNENQKSLPTSAPVFITWNKNDNLRGCIGTFSDFPLEKGVSKFSISSAMHDPRFPAIVKSEINHLSVSVTLLANFVEIHDQNDWSIGENGLRISLKYEGEHYSGTFLPSVAEEQEWDKEATLYHLLKKAEFPLAKSNVKLFYEKGLKEGWLRLTKYDGIKDHLDYDDFLKIRSELV